MFYTLGAGTCPYGTSAVVLLLVHERLADQKKKHRKAAHFSALLTGTQFLLKTGGTCSQF